MTSGLRPLGASIAVLLLATAIHADWHFARPAHHRLSLDLSWHWLLAIPVFALAAVYVAKKNPPRPLAVSVLLIGLATLIGAVVEPAYEYFLGGATWDWAFGPQRTWAALAFVTTGVVAYAITLLLMKRDPTPARS
jgi:FtsH-binding integral membrane protein